MLDICDRTRLAVQDTRNADHQRDVAISHDKVGNVLRIQGDLGAALEHFQQYQEIFQRLVKQDPSNFAWHQDLYISHIRIGEVLELEANIQQALDHYVEALKIAEKLSGIAPKHEMNNSVIEHCSTKRIELHESLSAKLHQKETH